MSRLAREFARLYGAPAAQDSDAEASQQPRRAWVLELARPAEWPPLQGVWAGVQADLGLPAPAVAVNGADGLQLWFSMAEPLPPARGDAFLAALRQRYLPDLQALPPERLRWVAPRLPAERADTGCWAAYLAPDLAALFGETPWLDLPPGEEGQADRLAALVSITPAQFDVAMARLQAVAAPVAEPPVAAARDGSAHGQLHDQTPARLFLLSVMNDADAPLALRVEAAKALLANGRPG